MLSAKHGLVAPGEELAPYEETLNSQPRHETRAWSARVWSQLSHQLRPGYRVLAGKRYRRDLALLIAEHGCSVEVPMEGLGIGQQLQWLNQRT